MARPKEVLVAGDLVLDHHIYEGRRYHYGDGINPGVRVFKQVGGAGLIRDLIAELLGDDWRSRLAAEVPDDLNRVDESQHAYAFWRPFPSSATARNQIWRASEAMGFGAMSGEEEKDNEVWQWPPATDLPASAHTVVFSDGGMGFRRETDRWEKLNLAAAKWILLKTTSPLMEGPLWEELLQNHGDRLVVVCSSRDVRKCRCRVSEGLSWESTLEDVLEAIAPDEALAPLRRCRHVLIAFESEGGLWIDFGSGDDPDVHFVYDPGTIEGEHAYDVKGTAFGFLSCLTAAAARQIALAEDRPDFEAALEGGLSAMRELREKGHGPVKESPQGFPAKRLAKVIQTPVHRYSRAVFSASSPGSASVSAGGWSLLWESQKNCKPVSGLPTTSLARLMVVHGPIALENLPHLSVGNLLTVERNEIESLRTLSQLVRHYQDLESGEKPLSLGVFGPPGAGKSFAVKQLAKQLVRNGAWMEFNLSQFESPKDLIGAFHQVRDQVLQGKLPVAFFDEFDSQRYRWLQYLLAPMQDGRFQEGQLTHPLGQCIFIFAGATSWTFETFGPPPPQGDEEESKDYREFRLLKGPDFKSRLDGFLDVIGPNRRQVSPPPKDCPRETVQVVSGHRHGAEPSDVFFPIRRALMIRGEFRAPPERKLEIDDGVLRALLNVDSYRHGSRSLNKILQPLKVELPGPLNRSRLPSRGQLAMHTDAEQFLNLVHQHPTSIAVWRLSDKQIDKIGRAIHQAYDELGLKEGWATKKTPFNKLDDFLQRSNFAAAERMVDVLNLVGLSIDPEGKRTGDPRQVRQHLEYHLELMSDAEHEGWMKWHFDSGWRYGSRKDKNQKTHPALTPYRQLSDEDKNKDRNQIRNYPEFAEGAGMSLFFQERTSADS